MWKNKKYDYFFEGRYERDVEGERVFTLRSFSVKKRDQKKFTFESWQMAKKLGWEKVK